MTSLFGNRRSGLDGSACIDRRRRAAAVRGPGRRLILAGLSLTVLAQGALAQSQEELKALYEKKIAAEWFKTGGWSDDYAAARERAKKDGKVILAYFTRSYSP